MAEVQEEIQVLSDIEHVLRRPGMYLGEVASSEKTFWVVHEGKMQERTAQVNNGPYKLLDETLMNARDHAVKQKGVTYIKVWIDQTTSALSVENDGEGIPVRMHATENVYLPEIIFGHLRSSSNFGKQSSNCVGGQNGYGVKLAAIWSTFLEVDLVGPDADGKLVRYVQKFNRNLSEIGPPKITPYKKTKTYTKVTFQPDWAKFGSSLDQPMSDWLKRRVYDLAAVTDKKIKVYLNDEVVPIKSFQNYVTMFVGEQDVTFDSTDRWEFAVALVDTGEFRQMSFVNGIHTAKGGKHVDYLLGQIVGKLAEHIQKKKKLAEPIRPQYIKSRLFLFVSANIENPTFDSQTKETLTTLPSKFGSSCNVSEKFIEKLARTGITDAVAEDMKSKTAAASAKSDGKKRRTITGIPKLCDAIYAGTAKSNQCTLILTEGDSAKSAVLGGLTEKMRNDYGVYPLKGKCINPRVRNSSENKEIIELKQILGLKNDQNYESLADLRYGRVLIVTDQDLDGSHIKGLLVNMFDTLWPSLLRQHSFLWYMNTPIIKARKGGQERIFYSEQDYLARKDDLGGWAIKYYKGLGTSTSKEFAEYFQEGKSSIVAFQWTERSQDAISKVFDSSRADDRKGWLTNYDHAAKSVLDPKETKVAYEAFIDEQLIEFSMYDNKRSIPSVMDGLKPSQRKILYACFKKNIVGHDIKVAQLSGYVSEHTAYHHGEASLNGAIVSMAQDFVGSNNLNLLQPIGQFGTRLDGGDDSASERYIFTKLDPLARLIFRQEDDAILEYNDDDGQQVEPVFFAPIIPMALVNGSKGIGTGWSTEVLCYNPLEITNIILQRVLNPPSGPANIHPFYRGFLGTVENQGTKYTFTGCHTKKDELNYIVTELPVGMWTNVFKAFLESLIGTVVKEYCDHSTDTAVKFDIKLLSAVEDFAKTFKLVATKSTNNMHLFSPQQKLIKYADADAIIDDFFDVRLLLYAKRKEHLKTNLEILLIRATNKVRYIESVLDGTIELRGINKSQMVSLLRTKGLQEIDGDYAYLLQMPMVSVSAENVESLKADMLELSRRFETLERTTVREMWARDLSDLKAELERPAPKKRARP